MTETMTLADEREFAAYDARLDRALAVRANSVLEIGEILWAVRQKRLYRKAAATFEDYCRQKCDFTRSQGIRYADAYGVARNIAGGDPEKTRARLLTDLDGFTEKHGRELKRLPPEKQAAAWEEATRGGERPTSKRLAQIAGEYEQTMNRIGSMPAREQGEALRRIEESTERHQRDDELQDTYRLTAKRLRLVRLQMDTDQHRGHFSEGEARITWGGREVHVKNGLLGIVDFIIDAADQAADNFRILTPEEKLRAALDAANADQAEAEAEDDRRTARRGA